MIGMKMKAFALIESLTFKCRKNSLIRKGIEKNNFRGNKMGDCKYLYRRSKSRTDVFSQKIGGAVWTQSDHESAYVYMLDNDENVKSFTSQPSVFEFAELSYQPDFLVEMMDGSYEFVEVHPKRFMKKKYIKRLDVFKEYIYRRCGAGFRFIYTENINFQLIRNLRLLRRYKVNKSQLDKMLKVMSELPDNVRFGIAEELLKSKLGMGFSARILLFSGHYNFDWETKITSNTLITRSEI